MNDGLKMTRNEARKFNSAIRKTKFGKDISALASVVESFSIGHAGGLYSANFFEQAMNAMVPEKWLNYGPAWLESVHDRGENGLENMRYIGQPVIIEEITECELFGTMYKCRFVGEDHLDGEYVNNTMFTAYHLRQCTEAFPEFKTEKLARAYMETFGEDWTVQGTRQVDDDGNEVWAVGAWFEPAST